MKNQHGKLALGLTTLMLLLVLAAGSGASDSAARVVAPSEGSMDGLHGLLAAPYEGGGSGT